MKIEIAGTGYVSLSNAILRRSNVGADICIAITPTNRSPYFNMVKRLRG